MLIYVRSEWSRWDQEGFQSKDDFRWYNRKSWCCWSNILNINTSTRSTQTIHQIVYHSSAPIERLMFDWCFVNHNRSETKFVSVQDQLQIPSSNIYLTIFLTFIFKSIAKLQNRLNLKKLLILFLISYLIEIEPKLKLTADTVCSNQAGKKKTWR